MRSRSDAQLDLKALGKRAALAEKAHAEARDRYVERRHQPARAAAARCRRISTHRLSSTQPSTSAPGGAGSQIELDPRDLVRITNARVHAIAAP